MQETHQKLSGGPFITRELRPPGDPDLEHDVPLAPTASKEEIQRRAHAVLDEWQEAETDRHFTPEMWTSRVTRNPDISWTVLDGETVLLNLDNGFYYTLNRVGSVIWELFASEKMLEEVLAAICERFDVTKDVAREDLVALVTRLRQEGLILEERR